MAFGMGKLRLQTLNCMAWGYPEIMAFIWLIRWRCFFAEGGDLKIERQRREGDMLN